MRKIQLGVSTKNKKNAKMKLIYDFGLRESENKYEEKTGLPEIQLFVVED